MNKIFNTIMFLFLLGFSEIHAQYMFRHWDIVDGLSDNQIRNFMMTQDGRLIIRTVSNINIYNGAKFEPFYLDRKRKYKWKFNKYQIFKEYLDAEGRMWMKSPGYLSLFDFNTNQYVYDIDSVLLRFGIKKKLSNLFINESKDYWFLTDDNSFLFYDTSAKKLKIVQNANSASDREYGVPYELVQYKNLNYILYSNGIIRCWDSASGEFTSQDTFFYGKITEATDRVCFIATSTGNLWLMYNNAVCYYNRIENRWKEIATIKGASNFFTCMDMDNDGNIWVGSSWSGLRKIDAKTHLVEAISGLKLGSGGILSNDIQCLYADNNRGLWVGTLWQGMCYYNPSMYKFGLIQSVKSETLITNESVRCLLEDQNGDILIGTTNFGLKRYNQQTGEIKNAFDGFLSHDLCLSLYRDRRNRLWVGTYLNGFYCIDGQHVKNYNKSTSNIELYPNKNVSRAVYEDADGRFWVSVSNEGVGELDLNTRRISMLKSRHPEIAFHKLDYNFYPVDDSTFAVYGEDGIYYYNPRKDKVFIPEISDLENSKFADPNIRYYCIYKDSRGLEWFGTEQGLRIWDEDKKKVYVININDGLPNNSVSSIEEDDSHVYWISTVSGITKILLTESPHGNWNFELVNFDKEDGLQSGKFYDRSSLKSRNGSLYFGGHHGVNWFNATSMHYNSSKNTPVFTAFYLFNSLIKTNAEYKGRVILNSPINNTSEIELNYKENFISFEFAGLNYVNPTHTYYKYKLENYDQGWTEIERSGIGTASYTGLQPGEYCFVVYTANNDKVWGDTPAKMKIKIFPPFWMTGYAYLFYAAFLLILIFILIKYLIKRKTKKQMEIEEQKRIKQKEELDQMKFRFFTNVSHEFRTPLTLIMTPLNSLIQQSENPLKEKLRLIYRNANNMLELINQLLDFRKLEMGGEKLNLSKSDFVEFMKYIHSSFKEAAINRNIDFIMECECSELYMCFDKSKMQKILNNLYSNALKFTSDQGFISTSITMKRQSDRDFVSVDITDSGCGIEKEDIDSIFDRFYQSNSDDLAGTGSGIGLHLVKEYVLLHEGKISVNSEKGEGSIFSLLLPIDIECGKTEEQETQETHFSDISITHSYAERKTILVVEDNIEFSHFLVEQLSDMFNILEANDGEKGENLAVQKSPDLIISDLMMPKVHGLELCARIKSNIETSHIPFILLTARVSDEARIESYKSGADSYISKPFNMSVLLARIDMLFEQMERRKETFHKTIEISPSSITITSVDEEFVKKAIQFVEDNMDNPEYSVNQLSSDLAMSRTQLYRKFESITGLTPNDFIRSIRLKRAAQLLKDSSYNISEISDMVGFNSIKYFNKYFKEQFGSTPTQYRSDNIC